MDQTPIQWIEPSIGRQGPRQVRVCWPGWVMRVAAYLCLGLSLFGLFYMLSAGSDRPGLPFPVLGVIVCGLFVYTIEKGITMQSDVLRNFNAYPAKLNAVSAPDMASGRNPTYEVSVAYQGDSEETKYVRMQVLSSTLGQMENGEQLTLMMRWDGCEQDRVLLSALNFVEVKR